MTDKKRILIAEDEESNFLFLKASMRKIDAEIIWAKNGKEAIDICMENPKIDLIFMDINMPIMDGIEACTKILEIIPDVPIIAQTAYIYNETRKEAIAAGCVDYFAKPINPKDILDVVEKYLGNTGIR